MLKIRKFDDSICVKKGTDRLAYKGECIGLESKNSEENLRIILHQHQDISVSPPQSEESNDLWHLVHKSGFQTKNY